MGFLLAWICGCTLGASWELNGSTWAALVLVCLGRGLGAPGRRVTVLLMTCLLGTSWGSYRAPAPTPAAAPEGTVLVAGTVAHSRRVSGEHVATVLTGATVDGLPLPGSLRLRSTGPCAWPVGVSYEGRALVRSVDSAVGLDRLFATALSPGPPVKRCAAVRRPHEGLTLPNRETSSLFRALSLGDRSGLSPALRETFIDTGTMHLLAISGLHLGVVAWGLYALLLTLLCSLGRGAWTRDNPRLAAGLATGGIWMVVGQIEATDATLRAAWAISFILVGLALGRRLEAARALVLAAAGVVTLDPLAPLGASFQLSFMAVWAILRVARLNRTWRQALGEPGRIQSPRLRRLGARVLELSVVNLGATAVTAPLGLAWFGQLSMVGPLVNLVATPWVALVVVPGIAVSTALASLSPALGVLLAPALDWTLAMLLDVIEVWADLAGSSQGVRWPLWAGLVASLGVVGLLGQGRQRAAGALLLVAALGAVHLTLAPPRHWEVSVLDVGHGDAILLRGPRGETALIDAGGHRRDPDRGRDQARWRVLPILAQMGVDHLDLMVITHGDLDHVGGAAEIVRRIPVEQIWLSACPQHRSVAPLVRSVLAQGGQVVRMAQGRPISWGDAYLEVLWPPPGEACSASENDRSLVLKLETAHGSALFMGDASERVESRLIRRDPGALRSDVLKVGHHGSDSSSSSVFLEALRARVALVSGPGRRPGDLPAPSTLERLRAAGITPWVTGRDGGAQFAFEPAGAIRVRRLRTP